MAQGRKLKEKSPSETTFSHTIFSTSESAQNMIILSFILCILDLHVPCDCDRVVMELYRKVSFDM